MEFLLPLNILHTSFQILHHLLMLSQGVLTFFPYYDLGGEDFAQFFKCHEGGSFNVYVTCSLEHFLEVWMDLPR